MGLRRLFTALALRRVHVLLVEVPGWWSTRVLAEQELAARGWVEARSPADADVLLVCGRPGEAMAAAVRLVWDQLPGPRAQGRADAPADVSAALDRAVAVLADTEQHRRDAQERGRTDDGSDAGAGHADPPDGAPGDSSAMSDTPHGGMDHGGMEMAPAGIPLAGGGGDRDGLEMDVLRVPLGPVLPCWPAGLVLWCSLQGDVVVDAEVEVLGGGSTSSASDLAPRAGAARLLDRARQVLLLSGWEEAARQAARLRDDVLTGADADACLARLRRVQAMVQRSRVLKWSLRDLGRAPSDHGSAAAVPSAAGDVHDRLVSMLLAAGDLLGARGDGSDGRPGVSSRWSATEPSALPGLVTGLDLAAVRLVVASVAPGTASSGTSAVARVSGG